MADETFDAVIVGSGTKALFLAMDLIKYGGMRVGIFQRRHEIGGCLAAADMGLDNPWDKLGGVTKRSHWSPR